ncbi:MAG: hypothetical protein QOF31_1673, partial [Mycobacterium sp.]|nr:hypothetical protein [Mycobacterium sp.]
MRLNHHPHLTRQDRTQLLQSVAFTVGVGKTHIAQALGHAVARRGGDVRFAKTSRVLSDLAGGHADRTWGQRIGEYTKPLVLILDDFAMREHTAMHADDLYELISDRAVNGRPLILTSNRSPKDWYNLFPNPVVAESLLRVDLIILDELGFAPLDDTGTQLLFRLVAGAYEQRSLAIGSHWPFQ